MDDKIIEIPKGKKNKKGAVTVVAVRSTGVELSQVVGPEIEKFLSVPKRVNAKRLELFVKKCLAAWAPYNVPASLEQLRQGALNGDKELLKENLKTFGLVGNGGGITINNLNQNTNNVAANSAASSRGFDAVMRKLHEEHRRSEAIEAEAVEE